MPLQNIDRVRTNNWKDNLIEDYFYLDGISTKFGAVTYIAIREKKGLRLEKVRHKRNALLCLIFNVIKICSYLTIFIPIGIAIAKKKYRNHIEQLQSKPHVNNNFDKHKLGSDIQKNIFSYLSPGEGLSVCREWNDLIGEKYINDNIECLKKIITTINGCLENNLDYRKIVILLNQITFEKITNEKSFQEIFEEIIEIRENILTYCSSICDSDFKEIEIKLNQLSLTDCFQNLTSLIKLNQKLNCGYHFDNDEIIEFKSLNELLYLYCKKQNSSYCYDIYNSNTIFNECLMPMIIKENKINYAMLCVNKLKKDTLSLCYDAFITALSIHLIKKDKIQFGIAISKNITRNFYTMQLEILKILIQKNQFKEARNLHFQIFSNMNWSYNYNYLDFLKFLLEYSNQTDVLIIFDSIIATYEPKEPYAADDLFPIIKLLVEKNEINRAQKIICKFKDWQKDLLNEVITDGWIKKGNYNDQNPKMKIIREISQIVLKCAADSKMLSFNSYSIFEKYIDVLINNKSIALIKNIFIETFKASYILYLHYLTNDSRCLLFLNRIQDFLIKNNEEKFVNKVFDKFKKDEINIKSRLLKKGE